MNSDTNTTDTLATNARTTIDKLRADIEETQRDIEFQQLRLVLQQEMLAMLTGAPTLIPRAPRKRRGAQQEQQAPSMPAEEMAA